MNLLDLIDKLSLNYDYLNEMNFNDLTKILFKENDKHSALLLAIFSIFIDEGYVTIPSEIKDKVLNDKLKGKFNILTLIIKTLQKVNIIELDVVTKDYIRYKFINEEVKEALDKYLSMQEEILAAKYKENYNEIKNKCKTESLAFNELQSKIEYLDKIMKEINETR